MKGRDRQRASKEKARPRRVVLPVVLLMLLLAAAGVGYLVFAPFGPTTERFVEIPPRTGTRGIATALKQGGVLRSEWAFVALRELRGGTLKAGEYRFDRPVTLPALYNKLERGEVYTVPLLVPEGYNLFDIAAAAESAGLCSQTAFLEAARRDTRLIRQWDPKATSLEGYLFPDTYRFSRHVTPETMLAAMVHRFAQQAIRLGLDGAHVPRVVTMASLVEREVHLDAERPLVAGVFENRLRLGMPLQTDPAVQYASLLRGTWTGVIHQSELHSDSLYNTYTHPGLPPGPICNPGIAALKAALHPARTDYLYFVAGQEGATRFSRSLQEQNANVAAYRATRP